jgi:DNA-binding CsgD family transcriptional regulator
VTAASDLIGRNQEFGVLADLIDHSGERGGAIVVLGDPGIGKSSLLRAAAEYGRRESLRVLTATGIEAEAQLPFAGLHQLLRPVLDAADQLPPAQRAALAVALGIGDGPRVELFKVALATLSLLERLAGERPVLVIADDVQWMDRPTQDVLSFVARRVNADPIVVIGAVRAGHDVALTAAGVPQLDVGGLDDVSARAVLAQHGGALGRSLRERILRDALGNPLALVELPMALRDAADREPEVLPLTARLERAFASQVAGLPPLTRDALLIAAVDDSDALPEIVAGTSALAGQVVGVGGLEQAAAAGLVRLDGGHVYFRHPLVRSGTLQRESMTRRLAAHAALAEVLGSEPSRRVWHRAQSITGPDDEMADALEESHLVALRGSVTTAIWALERSAQLTTDPAGRIRRLLLAAEHAFQLGQTDLVDDLLAKADTTTLSPLQRARMEWLREIFHDGVPGDAARVFQLCAMAGRSIEAGDTSLALNLLFGAGLRCWWADTGPAARARVAEVTQLLSRQVGSDPRYAAALALAEPVLRGRQVIQLLQGVVLDSAADPVALWMFGGAATAVGEPVLAMDFFARAEASLRQQGRLGLLAQVLVCRVSAAIELGEWRAAESDADEGRRLAQETGQPVWITASFALKAIVTALRGHYEQAQAMADQVENNAGAKLTDLLANAQLARGFSLVTVGQYDKAYDQLRRMFDPGDPTFHPTERYHAVMFLAEAAVHADRVDDARAVVAALAHEATVTPSATLARQLTYARAVLADPDDAETAFLTALAADLSRWRWLRARLELEYGKWLRRQRRVADSRRPLRSAMATFDLIGAVSWAEQARAELRATGERVATRGQLARDSLSAQELQIATLASEGLSNREIGERLYLSPRTVSSHMYRIFPKLDVTSRWQLAARLGSGGRA